MATTKKTAANPTAAKKTTAKKTAAKKTTKKRTTKKKAGTNLTVNKGAFVELHYRGTLADGTQFDSSYDRGEPIQVLIGEGRLIKGFETALLGM